MSVQYIVFIKKKTDRSITPVTGFHEKIGMIKAHLRLIQDWLKRFLVKGLRVHQKACLHDVSDTADEVNSLSKGDTMHLQNQECRLSVTVHLLSKSMD